MLAEGMGIILFRGCPGVDVLRARARAPHTSTQEVKGTRAIMKC